jgi:ribosomal-protein-alanine N-acetyltransferase
MSSEILLRDYRRSDIEAMFRLDENCFTAEFRFDRRSMRTFSEKKDAISLIVENLASEIVGFVIVHIERAASGPSGYIVTLDVAKEYRRRGMAAWLLRQAEVRARAAGADRMELHVFTGNEGAIHFYERMGYVRCGLRRAFYGQDGIDAFVYNKEIVNL